MSRTAVWEDRRFALLVAALAVAGCAFASFGLAQFSSNPQHPWIISYDAWSTTDSAQYLTYGGFGSIYSVNPWYSALPGFLILYAPVVALGEHFHLLPSYPFPIAHPSLWLLAGPFFFLCGASAVPAVDYLAQALGASRARRRTLVLGTAFFVVIPTAGVFGHPEDLLGLSLCCVSLALMVQGRSTGAALWLSCAVMMQTWAGLLIPAFVAASPAGTRLRTLVRSSALPATVGLLLLGMDWHDASIDLLRQPMPGRGQHLPWWHLAGHVTMTQLGTPVSAVAGASTRSLAVVAALALGWSLRRSPDPQRLLLSAALALYCRGLFETQFWPYYLAPAAVLFAVVGASATAGSTKRFAVVLAGAALLYGSAPMSYLHVQYPASLALMVLVACGGVCTAASYPGLLRRPLWSRPRIPAQAG